MEKAGRRLVIATGLCSKAAMLVMLALAPSYLWALSASFIGGLLDNNLAVIKSYALESQQTAEDPEAAKACRSLGVVWGVGVMIGPELAGYLSNPSQHLPFIFSEGGIWSTCPYLLPLLISSLIALVGAGCALVWLDDSPCTIFFSPGLTSYALILPLSAGALIGFQELFPVWARASYVSGGLQWTEPFPVGQVQSVGALVAVVVQCYMLNHDLGLLHLRTAWALLAPVVVLFSFANDLSPESEWLVLALGYAYFATVQSLVFSRLYLAVKSQPWGSKLPQYTSAVSRALSPLILCALLAWGFDSPFPWDTHFPYFILAAVWIVCVILLSLPSDSHAPMSEGPNLGEFLIKKF
jgi:MFS family permease